MKKPWVHRMLTKEKCHESESAVARKMLIAIWHVLSEGKPYIDYKKPDTTGNS